VLQSAHGFADAFRGALQKLEEFYVQIGNEQEVTAQLFHSRFFPCYTKYLDHEQREVKFEYVRSLTLSHKSPFLAKLKDSGEHVVVKFVERYGVEAHKHLAKDNKAPRLRFCGSLDGLTAVSAKDTGI
jgi:hypothetical protein